MFNLRPPPKSGSSSVPKLRGFSVVELVIAVGVGSLLALVLGSMCMPRRTHCTLKCTSNLKQVGLACRIFASDNNERYPWLVSTNDGGTREVAANGAAYSHYLVMSNELSTPKILLCPQDRRTEATNFASLSDANLSYFVGLKADAAKPNMLLAGDRNLQLADYVPKDGSLLILRSNTWISWSETIHKQAGSAAVGDGSVQLFSTPTLQAQLHLSEEPVIRIRLP